MIVNNRPIHRTVTKIIQKGERETWEFECPICRYRAHYMPRPQPGRRPLVILAAGDPQARHVTKDVPRPKVKPRPTHLSENDVDDSLLPPGLRRQWEEMLSDVKIGTS